MTEYEKLKKKFDSLYENFKKNHQENTINFLFFIFFFKIKLFYLYIYAKLFSS